MGFIWGDGNHCFKFKIIYKLNKMKRVEYSMSIRKEIKIYKNSTTQLLLYILGLFILSFGICLVIKSNLGASPWDLLTIVLNNKTHIEIGSWSIINQMLMLLITSIVFQSKVNVFVIMPGFIQGLLMNLILPFLDDLNVNSVVLLLLGCALMALGLVIYTNQSFSANAIDNFTVALKEKSDLSFGVSKVITDMIPIILVMILGSMPTVFTALIYGIVPLFIFFYENMWEALSNINKNK